MATFKNKTIQWVKLDPQNPETTYESTDMFQWSLDVLVTGEEAQAWVDEGFTQKPKPVKDQNDLFTIKLKRPTIWKKSGNAKDPVKVLDEYGDAIDPAKIGNGTVANIQFSPYEWEFKGRKGKSTELQAVQIITLEVYEGGNSAGDEFSFKAKKKVNLDDIDLTSEFD